ncbi:hypothetical protein B0J14DRAFT_288986 [Halenospora varia]|nr:hypothetical protein B0J14DRAFT_288986 [Halenospora varia]
MEEHDILNGPYWFSIYTMFFATMSLVFYTWEYAQAYGTLHTLKDAEDGRDMLVRLAHRNMAAARCSTTLATIFAQLPKRLRANGRVMGLSDDSMSLGQSMERQEPQGFNVNLDNSETPYNLVGSPLRNESSSETDNTTIEATPIQVDGCSSQEDPPNSVQTADSSQTRSHRTPLHSSISRPDGDSTRKPQYQTTDSDSLSRLTPKIFEVDSNLQQTGLHCCFDYSTECNHGDTLEVQALNLPYSNSMQSLPYNFPWHDTVLADLDYATTQADHPDQVSFQGLAINPANFWL